MTEYAQLPALLDYLARAVSPYHAVAAAAARLEAAGFVRLDEADAWRLEAGGAYYLERGGSALAAFVVGTAPPAEAGFRLAAAHTDSPALRLRPASGGLSRNMGRVGVEIYGAPIVSGWLDRELAVAGRVAVAESGAADGAAVKVRTALVDSVRPVALVPNVAFHLNREVYAGYAYDPQTELAALVSACASGDAREGFAGFVAGLAGAESDALLGADLYLYDPAPPARFGLDGELVAAGRVDNLAGCAAALDALLESRSATAAAEATRAIALFGHEEIGSRTYAGADSGFLRQALERIAAARSPAAVPAEAYYRAAARSFLASIDACHAFHPGWPEKYDERTTPLLNRGPALKINGKQRYATDPEGEATLAALAVRLGRPIQRFEFRADQTPGASIGPMAAAGLGIRTVDLGLPILAMHSIRECFGAADQDSLVALLEGLFSGR
jgi:aspartyl aminopeptidase